MPGSITLYTAKACPHAQRVAIALIEAKAKFRSYQVDLLNKPDWYTSKVNPAGKVPAIAYGGPDVSPENPSPESVKLSESLILLEFVVDLFPEANLLPKDPILRARARFFIDVVSSKFVPALLKFIYGGEGYGDLLTAIEALQAILPATGSYALGEQYTIADISLTSFVARLRVLSQNELGKFTAGQGKELLAALADIKYKKFYAYTERLLERQSFKDTFDEEFIRDFYAMRFSQA